MKHGEKGRRIFAEFRFVYMLLYLILVASVALIPVRRATDGHMSMVYNLLAIAGVALLCVDLFRWRSCFTPKRCGLLILFVLACTLSSLLNLRYGILDNAKTIVWTCIQLFLFLGMDAALPKETHRRHFRILTEVFCVIWTIGVLWSLQQFVVQYSASWPLNSTLRPTREGFAEGRLFGVFTDPNYAALCSLAAIAFSAIHFKSHSHRIPCGIYHAAVILLQAIYLVLSGSRTAMIAALIAGVLAAGFGCWCLAERRGRKIMLRFAAAIAGGLLCIAALTGGFKLTQVAAARVPALYYSMTHSNSDPNAGEDAPLHTISFDRPDVAGSDDISNNRLQIWRDYAQVFLRSPVWGASPRNALAFAEDHLGEIYIVRNQYSAHSAYMMLFSCSGILGAGTMLPWLILSALLTFHYLIRRRKTPDRHYRTVFLLTLPLITFAIGAALCTYMFFNNMVIDYLFWVTLGYTLGLIRMSEPERYAQPTLPYRLAGRIESRIRALFPGKN